MPRASQFSGLQVANQNALLLLETASHVCAGRERGERERRERRESEVSHDRSSLKRGSYSENGEQRVKEKNLLGGTKKRRERREREAIKMFR